MRSTGTPSRHRRRLLFDGVAVLLLLLGVGTGYAWWRGATTGIFIVEGAVGGVRVGVGWYSRTVRIDVVTAYPGRAFLAVVDGHDDAVGVPRPHLFIDAAVRSRESSLYWPDVSFRRDSRAGLRSPDGGVSELTLADTMARISTGTAPLHAGLPRTSVGGRSVYLTAALLVPLALRVARRTARARRRRGRERAGLCDRCGYDLRESPAACPECGGPGRPPGDPDTDASPVRIGSPVT
jgi:hypothetical protein